MSLGDNLLLARPLVGGGQGTFFAGERARRAARDGWLQRRAATGRALSGPARECGPASAPSAPAPPGARSRSSRRCAACASAPCSPCGPSPPRCRRAVRLPGVFPGEHLEPLRLQVGLRLDADAEGSGFRRRRHAGARDVAAPGLPVLRHLPENHPGENAVPGLRRGRLPRPAARRRASGIDPGAHAAAGPAPALASARYSRRRTVPIAPMMLERRPGRAGVGSAKAMRAQRACREERSDRGGAGDRTAARRTMPAPPPAAKASCGAQRVRARSAPPTSAPRPAASARARAGYRRWRSLSASLRGRARSRPAHRPARAASQAASRGRGR